MSTAERINLHVQQLPQPLQIAALHFVEFLAAKLPAQASRKDELLWPQFSRKPCVASQMKTGRFTVRRISRKRGSE